MIPFLWEIYCVFNHRCVYEEFCSTLLFLSSFRSSISGERKLYKWNYPISATKQHWRYFENTNLTSIVHAFVEIKLVNFSMGEFSRQQKWIEYPRRNNTKVPEIWENYCLWIFEHWPGYREDYHSPSLGFGPESPNPALERTGPVISNRWPIIHFVFQTIDIWKYRFNPKT